MKYPVDLKNKGFTLIELLVVMAISSVILAIILMGYRVSMVIYDAQLKDTNMWVELREASASLSRDLRDANFVNPAPGGLLVSFTLNADGLTYSYYINSQNALVRQIGATGIGGRVIAHNMDPANTQVQLVGSLVSIDLVATQSANTARLSTSVKPRNI